MSFSQGRSLWFCAQTDGSLSRPGCHEEAYGPFFTQLFLPLRRYKLFEHIRPIHCSLDADISFFFFAHSGSLVPPTV